MRLIFTLFNITTSVAGVIWSGIKWDVNVSCVTVLKRWRFFPVHTSLGIHLKSDENNRHT
jgi:hypothetical protein